MDASDIVTGIGAYVGLKELLPRILGPTADYVGTGLKGLTEKGVRNVTKVFSIAAKRLGKSIDKPGQVSPRVFKVILNEAYFCENDLAAEYYGGILASSRTSDMRDDRGAYFASMVARLSTYQIRSHYVLYQCMNYVFKDRRVPLNHMELREQASVFVPLTAYVDSMECGRTEGMTPYVDHAIVGLINESLLSDYFAEGASRFYRLKPPCGLENEKAIGLVVAPTRLGVELFLASHGYVDLPVHQFFFEGTQADMIPSVAIDFTGVRKTPIAREWGPVDEPAKI